MVLREQQEELLREQEKTRLAASAADPAIAPDDEAKVPEEVAEEEEEVTRYGSKIIVIHPGSQNLRIGFASDALPKSIPNVIARRSEKAEFEFEERCPKRVKLDEVLGVWQDSSLVGSHLLLQLCREQVDLGVKLL